MFWGFEKSRSLGSGEVKIGEKVFRVEVANSMASRSQGLSGKAGLGEDEGMLFIFSTSSVQGFWMKDMKFALDMIWIKGEKIVGFAENVKPEPEKSIFGLTVYYSPEAVDRVLEVKAGTVAKNGFKVGSTVSF